jgi:hypothetical protein
MRVVDAQINILASPSHVWRILVDFPAYSDWNPYITEIEGCKNRSKPAPDFGRKRQLISAESGT